ncbi:MAG: FtsW/RodA/SpoVE family cell cycle protein, partial [Acidobacteria bacterium]|nr:FtsW/RodA/SpoVE family cell cycle protein [Acidobacteriota bacterium]
LGLVAAIVTQALFNISVVLSLVPTKGIPLPFISYGGSSLVPTLVGVGILLNISQYAGAATSAQGLEALERPQERRPTRARAAMIAPRSSAVAWQPEARS